MATEVLEKPHIICTKCGMIVTARMLAGDVKRCPACDEPDLRFFDLDASDWSDGDHELTNDRKL